MPSAALLPLVFVFADDSDTHWQWTNTCLWKYQSIDSLTTRHHLSNCCRRNDASTRRASSTAPADTVVDLLGLVIDPQDFCSSHLTWKVTKGMCIWFPFILIPGYLKNITDTDILTWNSSGTGFNKHPKADSEFSLCCMLSCLSPSLFCQTIEWNPLLFQYSGFSNPQQWFCKKRPFGWVTMGPHLSSSSTKTQLQLSHVR